MVKLPPRNRTFNQGESVGDFEILEALGDDGSFGRAYRVRWALLPTVELALKVYKPHVSVEAIRREVRAHEHILHPNVVRLLDSGITPDGNAYLLTELVDGQTLAEIFEWPDGQGRFNLCDGLLIAWQLLSATQSFHSTPAKSDEQALNWSTGTGIVHRDLTPRNIMVTDSLVAKVIDFGIASPVGALVRTATATAGFLPPGWDADARNGRTWEPWIDVFQIGSVVYYALTGDMPYVGTDLRALTDLVDQCPSDVEALLARSVSTDPDIRFGTAAEMLAVVEAAIANNGCEEPPETTASQPSSAARRVRDLLSNPNAAPLTFIANLTVSQARETILSIVRTEGPTIRSRLLRLVALASDQIVGEVSRPCDLAITELVAEGEIYLAGYDRVDHPGACFAATGAEQPLLRQRGNRDVWEVPAHELTESLDVLLKEYAREGALPVEAQIACDAAYIYDVPDWSFDAAILAAAVSNALEVSEVPAKPARTSAVLNVTPDSGAVPGAHPQSSIRKSLAGAASWFRSLARVGRGSQR